MDGDNGVIYVDLTGQQMPQLNGLYRFTEAFDLIADLFQKGLPAFFLEDIQGILKIG